MFTRTRETLVLILLAVLPFHALLVTVGTRYIEGPGNPPLLWLSLWKEALLGIILMLSAVFIIVAHQPGRERRSLTSMLAAWSKIDILDLLILALIAISLMVTFETHNDWKLYLFGFKYDFIPLVVFLVLRRVEWSDQFFKKAKNIILIVGSIVATYGIASFFLPQKFFVALGYSDLHSLYIPDGPLAAYQQLGGMGIRRIQSTLSGPNQLGLWLLLPWSIALLRRRWDVALLVFAAISLTFSRSAWIASALILFVSLWYVFPKKKCIKISISFSIAIAVLLIAGFMAKPELMLRAASTRDHLIRPIEAVKTIAANPYGLGLGTAGPASNRVSDACVHLPEGADASWAADRPDLCVFVGSDQVQPKETCNCPVLPENWYLQLGVEMGVLGFALFFALILLLLYRVKSKPEVFLPLLGISIAALFLHAWEDSAVSYSVWMLVAALI